MIRSLQKLFYNYRDCIATRRIKKLITLRGTDYWFTRDSIAELRDGSTLRDIVLHDHIRMHGRLASQSGGKIEIMEHTRIGKGTCIDSVDSIIIGKYCTIANNIIITDNNNHPINPEFRKFSRENKEGFGSSLWKHSAHKPIVIGENVWVGNNCRICKGVTIGDNAIIGACSVVTKDVPANSIAAGNPARIVKENIDQIPAPTSCEEFNNR